MLKENQLLNLSKISLLYVEDDLETREELQLILQQYVGQLYTAKNGKEGLSLYRQYLPDIVATDIQMPEMNGLSMSADIRAENPLQPIVILSAYNDLEYLFRALELEIQHYIVKPISVDRLLNKLADITEQLKLTQRLEQNQRLLEQYKFLVDEKAIVVKFDPEGAIIYANKQFCRLCGYPEQALIGQYYLRGFEKDTPPEILEHVKASLKERHKWQGILKKTNDTGVIYAMDASIFAEINAQNQIEEFIAFMFDVTAVHEQFERLSLDLKQDLNQQSHYLQEYQRALDIGTSLCVIDLSGKIISANQNFCAALDYNPGELSGTSIFELISHADDLLARLLIKIKEFGYGSKIIKITGKNGDERTFSVIVIGLYNQAGEVYAFMSLSHDISDSNKLNEEIIETQKELIYILGEVVENRSHETGMHIKRVALISELLAKKYGLSDEYTAMIRIASPLHDIGKVGIPDHILHKPGKLSADEFEIMKKHADLGFQLLNKANRPLIKMASTIAHEHHEFYGGGGYPAGLQGEDITIEARIVSLVDVFDALSSRRVYKDPWPDEDIIDYLIKHKGSRFDPVLVDLFLANFAEILQIRSQFQDVID